MVVDKFVEKSKENGMDVFRVFDALNDPRNLEHAMAAVKKVGGHAQRPFVTPCPRCTQWKDTCEQAGRLLDMGADSIALKDMAALLKPQPAYDIIRGIKDTYGDDTGESTCTATQRRVSLW